MKNNEPRKLYFKNIRAGYTSISINTESTEDADVVGKVFWLQKGTAPAVKYLSENADTFMDITGLEKNTTYTIQGAYYDSMVDSELLDAKLEIELSDPVEISTTDFPTIFKIAVESYDVDVGIALPNIAFSLTAGADILNIEYKEGTKWVSIYEGAFSSSILIPAPKLGTLLFRVRGIILGSKGQVLEQSPISPETQAEIELNLENPSQPTGLTLKAAKIQDTFERYDVKVSWAWNKGTGPGLKAFVLYWVPTVEFNKTGWNKAKSTSIGNSPEGIISNFPYNIEHKIKVDAVSYAGVNNRTSSAIATYIVNASTPLDSDFTKETSLEVTYSGIYAYRTVNGVLVPTFTLDAASGNMGLGEPVNGIHPIQVNGTDGTVSVDGAVITKKINAADFVLTDFTGKDNPALYTEGKTYADGRSGIWMGFDNADKKYKFDLGNASSYIRWTGTDLVISGNVKIGTDLGNINASELFAKRDVWIYAISNTKPATPTSSAYPPPGWSSVPVSPTSTTKYMWICRGRLNEITNQLVSGTAWSTPAQFSGSPGINGADGADGINGQPGADGSPGADGQPGSDGPPGADGQDGADGQPGKDGPPGADGADGPRGAGRFIRATSTGAWSNSEAVLAIPDRTPQIGDVVTLYKSTDVTVANTRMYNGSTWVIPALIVNGSMVVDGTITGNKIVAGAEIITPTLKGAKIYLIGTQYMKVSSSTPFGPDSLIEWYGPRLVDGAGNPSFSSLRKSNAIMYLAANGKAYFGGSIVAGKLYNTTTNNSTQAYAPNSFPVTLGPFTTNGNSKVVEFNFRLSSNTRSPNPVSPGNPLMEYRLERFTQSTGWTVLKSETFTGSFNSEYDPEFRDYLITEYMSKDFTITDSIATTEIMTYRIRVVRYIRRINYGINTQMMRLSSTEAV